MVFVQESSRDTIGDFTLEIISGSISPEVAGKAVRLLNKVWPEQGVEYSTLAQGLYDWIRDDPSLQLLLVWKDDLLVGHARLFQRVVKTNDGQMAILGLSSVCSHPDYRGQGIGKILVARAFEEVDLSHYQVCVFQTSVTGFYKKLGAVEVKNTFINRSNRRDPNASPWWEDHVMIYPDTPKWPEGEINLNGPGF